MFVKKNGSRIEITKGDITDQKDIEAVVNAANAQLRIGGGVAGAIHRKAGPELEKESRQLAPIEPGEAVITGGYNLPNNYVIHTLGPVYGRDKPEDKLLAQCYKNSLDLAEEKGIKKVAFPAISTGAFGYPTREAAKVAFTAIKDKFEEVNIEVIRFVLYSKRDFEIHKEIGEMILK
ncbi:MAG: macro domain-containing protein [Halanaerobiales bacterium]